MKAKTRTLKKIAKKMRSRHWASGSTAGVGWSNSRVLIVMSSYVSLDSIAVSC